MVLFNAFAAKKNTFFVKYLVVGQKKIKFAD